MMERVNQFFVFLGSFFGASVVELPGFQFAVNLAAAAFSAAIIELTKKYLVPASVSFFKKLYQRAKEKFNAW